MKSFEDKIKDKLEGYESSLPENSLAEFMGKLTTADGVDPKHRKKSIALLLLPVVAAVVLAILLLPHQQSKMQPLPHNEHRGSLMSEITESNKPAIEEKYDAPRTARRITYVEDTPVIDSIRIDMMANTESELLSEQVTDSTEANEVGCSPFAPLRPTYPVDIKSSKTAFGIIGGIGSIVTASALPFIVKVDSEIPDHNSQNYSADTNWDGGTDGYNDQTEQPAGNEQRFDKIYYTHHMPLRAGTSIRIPLSTRWSIVTGFDYSWYSSSVQYIKTIYMQQNVHYLGIPLRADFTIFGSNIVTVYAGAGGMADFCIAANLDGKSLKRDGVCFSLQGVGGVQLNLAKGFSIYIDPTVSWDIPSDGRAIETYRTAHPLSFTVSTGIRYTLP